MRRAAAAFDPRRRAQEAKSWVTPAFAKSSDGCTVEIPNPDDKLNIILKVPGPENYTVNNTVRPSPFKGHVFRVKVTLHESYPFRHPELEFLDVPYHPNVNPTGEFCIDIDKSWKPTKSIANVGKMLVEFLSNPNPTTPVDAAIGLQMTSAIDAFEAEARKGGRRPAAKKKE